MAEEEEGESQPAAATTATIISESLLASETLSLLPQDISDVDEASTSSPQQQNQQQQQQQQQHEQQQLRPPPDLSDVDDEEVSGEVLNSMDIQRLVRPFLSFGRRTIDGLNENTAATVTATGTGGTVNNWADLIDDDYDDEDVDDDDLELDRDDE